MIDSLKSELRKLISLRSSYLIPAFAFAFMLFISFYVEGIHNGRVNAGPLFLAQSLGVHNSLIALFGAVVGLLAMAHEYRYNTIMYTLTAANRRSQVLAGKCIAVFVYILVFAVVGNALCLLGMLAGAHVAGVALPAQDISLLDYFAKAVLYTEAWALVGLLLATLVRNQATALGILFIAPNTVEPLLGLLLKEKVKYLPFNALSRVVNAVGTSGHENGLFHAGNLSPWQGGLVFLIYLATGWIVAWQLFLRRDAN